MASQAVKINAHEFRNLQFEESTRPRRAALSATDDIKANRPRADAELGLRLIMTEARDDELIIRRSRHFRHHLFEAAAATSSACRRSITRAFRHALSPANTPISMLTRSLTK